MKKQVLILSLLLCMLITASGCSGKPKYEKYSYEFMGAFDTVFQLIGYAENQKDFESIAQVVQNRFMELNQLYDIYNDYEGINNIKTINDNAGIKPVEVKQEIIDLINFSKEWYYKTNGKCNIALGSMLAIWHDYRNAGINNPEEAKLPPMSELKNAMKHTNIDKIIVDDDKNTVYLDDKDMRLDVGAVAKGFASELVANEIKEKGCKSLIISAGGNVVTIGQPLGGQRDKWGIGIQDPDGNPNDPTEASLDILYLKEASLVTSGDYQRAYTVDGKKYHHLIDPETLMPAEYFRSVTVLASHSGLADFMSTTLFLTPYEEGIKLAQSVGVDVIWIMKDKTIRATDNAKSIMKNLGGAVNTKE